MFEDSRLDEVALKNNLQIIRKAIEANKGAGIKIAFHFNGYDENKKLKVRTDSDGNKLRYVAKKEPKYFSIMDDIKEKENSGR